MSIFFIIGSVGIFLNSIKDKTFICMDSINYKPGLYDLDLNKLHNINSTELVDHYQNMEVCLSYSRVILAISCNKSFLKNNKDLLMPNIWKILYYNESPSVFIISNNNHLLISFRGTTTINNIITDLDTKLINIREIKDKNVLVYSGVYNYLSKFKNPLNKYIEETDVNNIFITGHSLGGAMSILYSFIVSHLFPTKKIFNYNSASMKVGNIYFAEAYKTTNIVSVSLVNKSDWVPKFPWNKEYITTGSLGGQKNAIFNNSKGIIQKHFPSIYYKEIRNSILD